MWRRRLLTFVLLCLSLCAGSAAMADVPSTVPDLAPPAPPWVGASEGRIDYVQVSWLSSFGASSYKVYRSYTIAGTKSYLGSTAAGLLQYHDLATTSGVTYYYWVRACNGADCSGYAGPAAGYRLDPPLVPGGITASDGTDPVGVQVTWQPSAGATSYQVRRSDTRTGPRPVIATTTSTSYRNASVLSETVYYYWVDACIEGGCSESDPNNAAHFDTGYWKPSPPAPGPARASDGAYRDRVHISWYSNGGTTDYFKVYRSLCFGCSETVLGTTTGTSFDDDAPPSTTRQYYYYVRACTDEGLCSNQSEGDWGYQGDDLPPAPSWVQASDGTETNRVYITWQDSPESESFKLYRGATPYDPGATMLMWQGENYFTDSSAWNGSPYYYWVKACNIQGCSSSSPADSGYAGIAPAAPDNVQASDGAYTDKVRVSWNAVTVPPSDYITGYHVYRADSVAGAKTLVSPAYYPQTSWDDTSAVPGQSCTYWVIASGTHGDSDYSAPDSGYRATDWVFLPLAIKG